MLSDPLERQNARSLLGLFIILAVSSLIASFLPVTPRVILLGLSPLFLICLLITRTAYWKLGGLIAFTLTSFIPFWSASVGLYNDQGDFISPLIYLVVPTLVAMYLMDMLGIIATLMAYSIAIISIPLYIPSTTPHQAWNTFFILVTVAVFTIIAVRQREKNRYSYGRAQERKIANAELEEQEKKYRDLFNFANDAIILVDPATFAILDINEISTTLFGFKHAEIIGADIDSLLPPNWEGETMLISGQLGRDNHTVFESSLFHQDGYEIPVEFSSRMVNSGGQAVYHCIVRDISKRKLAEEQLTQYSKRLETLNQIGQSLISIKSPEEIANYALRQLRAAIHCRMTSLYKFDHDDGSMIIFGVDKSEEELDFFTPGERIPFDEVSGSPDHMGVTSILESPGTETERLHIDDPLFKNGSKSYISIPIIISTKLWGSLNLHGPISDQGFSKANIEMTIDVANLLAIALQQTSLFKEISLGRARLQTLSRRLVEAQEAERHRIANELHDEIGQALTGINLSLETHIRAQVKDVDYTSLREAQKMTEDLISRVQAISLDLRPAMLDDLGLLPTLTWHFDRYETQTGIKVNFEHRGLQDRFKREIETAAYRIVQEALTNVARHSGVKEVKVHASLEGDIVLIFIEDRGGGFSVEKALISGNASGLVGMRERALSLGGDLTIISTKDSGSQIMAKLPLSSRIERRSIERRDD